jgi:subtilisin family serine protease
VITLKSNGLSWPLKTCAAFLLLLLPWICTALAADVPPAASVGVERSRGAAPVAEEAVAREARHQALLDRAQRQGRIPVIVRLRVEMVPEAALRVQGIQAQRARLGDVQRRVLERLSSTARFDEAEFGVKRFALTPALALQADALDLQELLADPEVAEVIEDRVVRPTLAQSVPLIGADVSGTFAGYTGQGQVVAILDTGVDKNHSFLSGKVISEACYSSNVPALGATSLCPGVDVIESTANNSGLNCDASIEGCDHGTHVAGIAAGSGSSFSGVAKDAKLIAIQVFSLDAVGLVAFTSDIIKGLERVYELRQTYNIAAANLSLGGGEYNSPCDNEPEKPVIDQLRAAGIATVIASGNDGFAGFTNRMNAPACISTAVSVGSTTKQDFVSWFSNNADFLDLLAPGSSINSSVPGGAFDFFNGTSMAAPHVAGAWAVLKEAALDAEVDPGVAGLLEALQETGVPVTDTRIGANNRVKPRIQVDAALPLDPNDVPGKPDTLVPSGVIQTARPTYQWNAVTAAHPVSDYHLTAAGVVDQEYSAAAAGCAGGGTCAVTPAVDLANTAATWKVRAKNSFGFGSWSDPRSFQVTKGLANGVSMTGLSGTEDSEHYFHLQVPTGATNLQVAMSGGTGDADLYVRFGALPTLTDWDCRPWLDGNKEACPFPTPTAGTYYVMLHSWSAYSGVTLVASYTDPCPELVLDDETVNGTQSFESCRITAGPAFVVTATGNATFQAGERITLRPGFRVQASGRFQARMDPSLRP